MATPGFSLSPVAPVQLKASDPTAISAVSSQVPALKSKKKQFASGGVGVGAPSAFYGQQIRLFRAGSAFDIASNSKQATIVSQTLLAEPVLALDDDEEEEDNIAVPEDFNYDSFQKLLQNATYTPDVGETISGTVFSIEQNGVLVDVGGKCPALVPLGELAIDKFSHASDILTPGEVRNFFIIKPENDDGQLTLSLKRILYKLAWEKARVAQAADGSVEGEVLMVNRGGAIAKVDGLRGFIPTSHLVSSDPASLVGTKIMLKFLEVDEEKNRLIMSHRKAMLEKQMTTLEVGQIAVGVVKSVKPYGAFVDIGGISGLLHISQISQDHIDNVNAVLAMDERIKVMVIHQDADRGRISLSTKHLEPEPGDMLRNRTVVWAKAEEMAEKYRLAMQAKEEARAMHDANAEEALVILPDVIPTAVPETSVAVNLE